MQFVIEPPNDSGDCTKPIDQSTSAATKERINAFIKWKRAQINASNLTEFLSYSNSTKAEDDSCARVHVKKPDSSCSIQRAVVENWEGPLDRATTKGQDSEASDPMTKHLVLPSCKLQQQKDQHLLEDRMQTIEQHMHIEQSDTNPNCQMMLQRIKRVEDKIIEIETKYPFLAAYHFNYEQQQPPANERTSQEPKSKAAVATSAKAKSAKVIQDETYNKLVRIKRSMVG